MSVVEDLIPNFDVGRDRFHVLIHNEENPRTDSWVPNTTGGVQAWGRPSIWIHELGHSLGLAHEEDPARGSLVPEDEMPPNLTNVGELTEDHRWAHFFAFDGEGVVLCEDVSREELGPGDSVVGNPHDPEPPFDEGDYWDTDVVNGNHVFNTGLFGVRKMKDDTLQYAPSLLCRSRHDTQNVRYCAVCAEAIAKHILGEGFDDDAFHGDFSKVLLEHTNGAVVVDGSPVGSDCGFAACITDITDAMDWTRTEHSLVLSRQNPNHQISLTGIGLYNGSGARINVYPVTDVSSVVDSSHAVQLNWNEDELELRFLTGSREPGECSAPN